MTKLEPETRHLSRAELSRVLRDLHEPDPEPTLCEPKTTLWSRPERSVTSRSREPVTQLELQIRNEGKVRSESLESNVETDRMSSRLGASRAVITQVGLGVLVAGCAWWIGLRPPPPSNASAEPPRASATLKSVASADPPLPSLKPLLPSIEAQPPSPRAAVDLLLAGRQREALDAYRALSLGQPNEPSFATVVSQLERELASCDQESGPCTP